MPAKLTTELQIPSDNVPNYDEVVITSIITPVHFNGNGNIEIGDTIEADENGYIKTEKHVTHYLLLLAGVVVYKSHIELEGADLITAMGRNPNARNEMKNSAYDILNEKGLVPNNAAIS